MQDYFWGQAKSKPTRLHTEALKPLVLLSKLK